MLQRTQQKISDLDCVIVKHESCEAPEAVVILCHGFGAPPTDLVSLADAFVRLDERLEKVAFVFPGAPIEMDPLFDSRAWWMIDIEKIQQLMMDGQTRQMRSESPELLPERRASLIRVIDHCRVDYNLPAEKIVIGGFSQGSMLTTDVALHYEGGLGGLIVWSGALINEPVWKKKAEEQSPLTIVQSHGQIDPILPIGGAHDLKEMLITSEHEVRYFEFDGQHSIPPQSIQLAAQLIVEVAAAPAS
jgi:phospholipase/carboxylesterase